MTADRHQVFQAAIDALRRDLEMHRERVVETEAFMARLIAYAGVAEPAPCIGRPRVSHTAEWLAADRKRRKLAQRERRRMKREAVSPGGSKSDPPGEKPDDKPPVRNNAAKSADNSRTASAASTAAANESEANRPFRGPPPDQGIEERLTTTIAPPDDAPPPSKRPRKTTRSEPTEMKLSAWSLDETGVATRELRGSGERQVLRDENF